MKDKGTSGGVQNEGKGSDGGKRRVLDSGAVGSGNRKDNNEMGSHAERTTISADIKVYSRAGRTP